MQLLEISRFQFDFSMIIPEIHSIFDLILFNFRFNFHIGTTHAGELRGQLVLLLLQTLARSLRLAAVRLPVLGLVQRKRLALVVQLIGLAL